MEIQFLLLHFSDNFVVWIRNNLSNTSSGPQVNDDDDEDVDIILSPRMILKINILHIK